MPQEAMKSIKKALEILNIFLNSQDELSLTEISKKSGLSSRTTSRILTVLAEYSYLNKSEKRGKYSIDDIYLNFNYTKSNKAKVRNIAIPHIKRLSREMNEVTAIAFANGAGDISVEGFEDYVKPTQPILRILMNETSGKTLIKNGRGETIGYIGIIAPAVRLGRSKIIQTIPALIKCATDISNEIKDHAIYF